MNNNITPDIAELIGAYNEGNHLTQDERNLVQQILGNNQFKDIQLTDISPLPDFMQADSRLDDMIPIGTMAMDFIDDNPLIPNDMQHTSIIGDITPFPGSSQFDIIQQQSDTCAIKSQQIILHSFGIDIPEAALTIEATHKGYYIPGHGSNPLHVGDLLDDHGVGTHTKTNATIYDLVAELAQGHKVIVGVDADELWRPSYFNDLFGEQANHALVVTGIDTTNPNDIRVIITDPGTGDVARSYPVAQFLDAWHDSSCLMVATDEAPALTYHNGTYNHEMVNFDYTTGHISHIGHIPYDIFADTMVPRMDDYFTHHLPELHSSQDFDHIFDHMNGIYDSFDDLVGHNLANNDFDDFADNLDFDDMFDSLF